MSEHQGKARTSVFGWLILPCLYIAAAAGYLVAVNADQRNAGVIAFLPLAVVSLAMVWWSVRRSWMLIVLPVVFVVLGLPFGSSNANTGGGDLDPVAWIAVFPAIGSALLMAVAVMGRALYDRRGPHQSSGDQRSSSSLG